MKDRSRTHVMCILRPLSKLSLVFVAMYAQAGVKEDVIAECKSLLETPISITPNTKEDQLAGQIGDVEAVCERAQDYLEREKAQVAAFNRLMTRIRRDGEFK